MKVRYLLIICATVLMAACSTSNESRSLVYFENLGEDLDGVLLPAGDYTVRIEPRDELIITVTSLITEATAIYNVPLNNPAVSSSIKQTQSPTQQTYIVDENGEINFPVLGELKVAGMTTLELRRFLEAEIGKDVEDPYVHVQMVNYRVNVLGEVNSPGTRYLTRERCTLLEVLAMSGDLTQYGMRDNVILIREEENGDRTYHRLNLNDAEIFSSPYFYVKQNDVIYVVPNDIKRENSKYNTNNAYKLSVLSTIVSACSVVVSLIIAFAVK